MFGYFQLSRKANFASFNIFEACTEASSLPDQGWGRSYQSYEFGAVHSWEKKEAPAVVGLSRLLKVTPELFLIILFVTLTNSNS